jgi:hypothetical protein
MAAKQIALGLFAVSIVASQATMVLGRADDSVSAIVSELRGSATVEEASKPRRAVRVYDWITEGSMILVARHSTVIIVFASGARYELLEGAQVRIVGTSVPASATVRSLPPLPPLPVVPPIAIPSRTAGRLPREAAAVRIRGLTIRNLYPSDEGATIAESTTLKFDRLSGASAYLVTVLDERYRPIFELETGQTVVIVPVGALEAGRRYQWSVTVADDVAIPAQAEAVFKTLPASDVKSREAFIAGLRRENPRDLGLLAALDKELGLMIEARNELMTASALAPKDGQLRRMLADVNKQLQNRN